MRCITCKKECQINRSQLSKGLLALFISAEIKVKDARCTHLYYRLIKQFKMPQASNRRQLPFWSQNKINKPLKSVSLATDQVLKEVEGEKEDQKRAKEIKQLHIEQIYKENDKSMHCSVGKCWTLGLPAPGCKMPEDLRDGDLGGGV